MYLIFPLILAFTRKRNMFRYKNPAVDIFVEKIFELVLKGIEIQHRILITKKCIFPL